MSGPTRQELEEASCWFSVDRTSSVEVTEFKTTARLHQHRWALSQGIVEFGSHRKRDGSEMVNGTKLTDADAAAGRNFLSAVVQEVVEERLRNPQPLQTLEPQRLRRDLLSSMPMAFNLFGEASRYPDSQQALLEILAPDLTGSATEIVFEWAPARSDAGYTRDRTAFDVALLVGSDVQTVVGIETKYHEHSTPEKPPSEAGAARHADQTDFLVDLSESSDVFVDGWRDGILGTDLRQLWRDHLLALSMRRRAGTWGPTSRYVLVHPARNTSFRDAAERYRSYLRPDDSTFTSVTVEELVDAAFAHDATTGARFRERYLW